MNAAEREPDNVWAQAIDAAAGAGDTARVQELGMRALALIVLHGQMPESAWEALYHKVSLDAGVVSNLNLVRGSQ